MSLLRNLIRGQLTRSLSTASVTSSVIFPAERMPLLEEILEPPVLRISEMRAETVAEVKGFVPPVLPSQIEASLCTEFGHTILESNWDRYEDPTTSYEQAARLIHHTLAIYSNVGKAERQSGTEVQQIAKMNQEWVRKECELLVEEIKTVNYDRWELAELLAGEQFAKMTAAQKAAVRPAIAIISKNAWLHPRTKGEVVQDICRIVTSTIKN